MAEELNFYLVELIQPVQRGRYWVRATSFDDAAEKAVEADMFGEDRCSGVKSVEWIMDGGAVLP